GMPLLMERTISRQITLESIVGVGRYGEVWKASWSGENIAVKIFKTIDEQSWKNEVDIYQTNMIHHASILNFIAADSKDIGDSVQLWIVTSFHPFGSLFDYLTNNELDEITALKMSLSIAHGLSHLHMYIPTFSLGAKPSIAHRDFKSKNILVKNDLSCCISDFGKQISSFYLDNFGNTNNVNVNNNNRIDNNINKIGTTRYMAPELLDGRLQMNSLDVELWKLADIYSMSLIFWEIATRTNISDLARPYQLPYFDSVSFDPTMDEMNAVVNVQRVRPALSSDWNRSVILKELMRSMTSCWFSARLTALCVKKNLLKHA
ncbi:hypothetical protein HELRODRAFT_75631, partial [Helobdella robusta]|uniref:receptor protein serine/threonine kinase n=1 Tax=Helobdella robusta TaxID=6412 RepID=T1G279_HELRO